VLDLGRGGGRDRPADARTARNPGNEEEPMHSIVSELAAKAVYAERLRAADRARRLRSPWQDPRPPIATRR
jgi:hypothetical protein